MTEVLISKYEKSSDEERLRFIHSIHQTSKSLHNLLENLLEWSRMQSGSLAISPEPLNLRKIAKESLTLHDDAIREKAQKVKLDIHAEYQVLFHPARIRNWLTLSMTLVRKLQALALLKA